ncbi:MAG: nitroreductase family protein [Bacteroidota bacterium]
MMNTILNHVTIRKYKQKEIAQDLLNSIIYAGTRASTTGNMQIYSIIVTMDNDMKKKLSPLHFNQPMVESAPVVMTFCADFNRFNKWCTFRDAKPGYDNFLSFFTAAIDAILVAQNVALAAESNGLGICYLGTTTYMAKEIINVLDLPKGVIPVTTLTIGYPDENPELTDRLPVEAVVHYEKYKDYIQLDIDKFYAVKENRADNKKFVEENNKKTLSQVFTDVRYKKADNIFFSKKLLDVLKEQGFMDND